MEIPPPSVPEAQLTDWLQTDRTVDAPFSTPIVSVQTHTVVYEETVQREQIRETTGFDHPWRFFFSSRVRFDPPQSPNPMLSSLLRSRIFAAFVDRLEDRGLTDITEQDRGRLSVGGIRGVRKRYRARLRVESPGGTDDPLTDPTPLSVPVEALVVIWADTDYHVAGGAYPVGPPEQGPDALVAALGDVVDPTAHRNELVAFIKSSGQ